MHEKFFIWHLEKLHGIVIALYSNRFLWKMCFEQQGFHRESSQPQLKLNKTSQGSWNGCRWQLPFTFANLSWVLCDIPHLAICKVTNPRRPRCGTQGLTTQGLTYEIFWPKCRKWIWKPKDTLNRQGCGPKQKPNWGRRIQRWWDSGKMRQQTSVRKLPTKQANHQNWKMAQQQDKQLDKHSLNDVLHGFYPHAKCRSTFVLTHPNSVFFSFVGVRHWFDIFQWCMESWKKGRFSWSTQLQGNREGSSSAWKNCRFV